MVAACLAILLAAELTVLGLVGACLRARGQPVPEVFGICILLALSWRAALVAFGMFVARVDRGLDARGALGRIGAWLSLCLRETGAMSAAYLAMTIEPLRSVLRRPPPAEGAPAIILVHGWCCNAGVWRPVVRRLRRAGLGNVHGVTLHPVLGCLDAMAADLERLVSPLRATWEGRRIVLAAHSMGGLVARAWLRRLDAVSRERVSLVTIGTPHCGTRVAALGAGAAARQMRPGSAWLAGLAAEPDGPADLTCIGSRADNFVAPQGSAWLPGARAIEVPGVGHFALLMAPATIDALIAACRLPQPQGSAG